MEIFLTFLLVLIAIGTFHLNFYRKPKLSIHYEDEEPYRKLLLPHKGTNSFQLEWFVRILIKNTGKIKADNCFGKITEWYTGNKRNNEFDPVKLHWVQNDLSDYSNIKLSNGEKEYLDLFFTNISEGNLQIYTNIRPRGTPILFDLTETYIFKVEIFCDKSKTISQYFKSYYLESDPSGKLKIIHISKLDNKIVKKIL